MKKKTLHKAVLNLFLSFLLALLLVLDTALAIAFSGPINPDFLKTLVDETGLAETAQEYIARQFADQCISSGFEENFVKTLADAETIRSDMHGEIDWMFGGEGRFNRTAFKKELSSRLLRQVEAMGEEATPETKENIYEMCDTLGTIYKASITFPFEQTLRAPYRLLYANRWLILACFGLFTLFLVWFLYWLNHRQGRAREQIQYAVITAALVPLIPGISLSCSGLLSNLLLPNPVTREIFAGTGRMLEQGMLLAGAVFAGSGVLLALTAPRRRGEPLPAQGQDSGSDVFEDLKAIRSECSAPPEKTEN